MNLMKSKNTKYDEYEALLLERDQIRKEAGQIWTAYIRQFGRLITDLFEEKLECIKCKKTIAYYQNALNYGRAINPQAMQEFLEREMAAYNSQLKRMIEENERCQHSKMSTAYEVRRSKALYRRLAKLIHPDIFPETDKNDVLRELWDRILTAYKRNDVKALAELEVLVRKALGELGFGEIRIDIPDIEERIGDLKTEIDDILHTEPYIHKYLLEDNVAACRKKKELEEELETWRNYHNELDGYIEDMVQIGGVRIRWQVS